MKIKVNDEFYLEDDGLNFTMFRIRPIKSGKNEGQLKEELIGHYSSLEIALFKAVRLELLNKKEFESISEYVKETNKKVMELLKSLT